MTDVRSSVSRRSHDGVRAIVTGGASGIGAAIVQALQECGATVAVLDLQSSADGVFSVPCDVSDDDSVRAAVDAAVAHLGGLDVLVNNAGIGAQGTVEDNPDDEWRRVYEVNVLGTVRLSRAALPHLRASGNASIVNTCSIAATAGLPQRALYSATKGAIAALTRAMAADHLREGVRVNAVAPGPVATPLLRPILEGNAVVRDTYAERIPLGRVGEPDEIAAAILFLASPDAAYVSGVTLPVDGGLTSWTAQPALY